MLTLALITLSEYYTVLFSGLSFLDHLVPVFNLLTSCSYEHKQCHAVALYSTVEPRIACWCNNSLACGFDMVKGSNYNFPQSECSGPHQGKR